MHTRVFHTAATRADVVDPPLASTMASHHSAAQAGPSKQLRLQAVSVALCAGVQRLSDTIRHSGSSCVTAAWNVL